MSFRLSCKRGRSINVSAAQAGIDLLCDCGEKIAVPLLSRLKSHHQADPAETNTEFIHPLVILVCGTCIALAVAFMIRFNTLFLLSPISLIFIGKIWFLALIIREMGAPALLVFVVPGFDWLFLFKRFDIAWMPFLLQFAGIVLGLYLYEFSR